MFLSNFSIRRPVAMTAFIIVLLLAGFNSYRKLGLDNMPDIEIPYVTITTTYPGASPREIEVDVAKKIEDAVCTIDGLKHVNSTCMENVCLTTLEFDLSVDVDVAGVDVREKIDLILDDLPEDVEPPEIAKFDPNAKAVVTLLLTGNLPIDKLYDFADEELSDQLSTIPGVAEVQVSGGEELEVHIILDKDKLSANGLTVADIITKLNSNNLKVPSGNLKDGVQEISVTFDAEFKNFSEIESLEVGSNKGRIYLRDIGTVEMISKDKRTRAFYNGRPAVNVKIVKKGEANAAKVVDRIRKTFDRINKSGMLPSGMKLVWFTDDGEFIKASVDDAWGSIGLGVLLTALILFMFLHEVRSTFIVCLSMPSSIIITFLIMKYFDYTFNNSTLLALGTSVGVLVTNSIVVVENIFKKLHEGKKPKLASETGSGEVALPVFASAATNVVVFVPIALMSSLVGRYFIPFAVTMTAATLVSLFISFTLTPLLSSIFLRDKMPKHWLPMRIFIKCWESGYSRVTQFYDSSLHLTSKQPWITLLLVVTILVLTMMFVAPHVGMSFFPDNDRGEFIIKLEYPTDYNINTAIKRTLGISAIIRSLPEVKSTSTVVGKIQGTIGKISEGVHLAEITIKTTGKKERKRNLHDMKKLFWDALKNEINCITSVNIPSIIGGSESEIEMQISGADLKQLDKLGLKAANMATTSGMMSDVDTNVRPGKPEIRVVPKRPILEDMNLSSELLGTMLRGNIEGIKAGTYKRGDRSYDIRVELKEQDGVDQVREFSLMSRKGRPMTIETVAELKNNRIPIQIARAEKKRNINFYANPAPGAALSDAVTFLQQNVPKILPGGYNMRFTGRVEKMQEAQMDFLEAIITAAILTYLLIAAVLESWVQPIIILLTLPLALAGMFGALFVTGNTLSMMGLLGAVMLIGIVVNNAILIMDQVIILRALGVSPREAMLTAAKDKFRPIVMTSIAAIIGIAPMAFGSGLGSEIRSSCGITVIGGLISSTILALYVIPLVYIQFVRDKKHSPESHEEK